MISIRQTLDVPPSRKVRFDVKLPETARSGVSPGSRSRDSGWRRLYGLDKKSGDTVDAFLDRKHADKALEDEIDARLRK